MNDIGRLLEEMVNNFSGKIDDQYSAVFQFEFTDLDRIWHINIQPGRKITIGENKHDNAQFLFRTDTDSFKKIVDGKITAMTAAGKASASDKAPLDMDLADDLEFTSGIRGKLYEFLQHFFFRGEPEKILLGEQYSRLIHGGHAIPLYYDPGFRSAWYMIKKGEQLNKAGDTNPFPQAFIITEGEGSAKIGDITTTIKEGESYFIPPLSDHVIMNRSNKPLVLIWLAWGEGA